MFTLFLPGYGRVPCVKMRIRMKATALAIVAALTLCAASTAHAAVVTLTESFFGSGDTRPNGNVYDGVEISLSATYNTDEVQGDGSGGFMVASPISEDLTFGGTRYAITADPYVELEGPNAFSDSYDLYIGEEPTGYEDFYGSIGPTTSSGFTLTSAQNVLTSGSFFYEADAVPGYDIQTGEPFYTGIDNDHLSTPVTITETVAAAPEPSTWALMLAGIGGVGLRLRRARKSVGFGLEGPAAA
jgi:hypothetical protein